MSLSLAETQLWFLREVTEWVEAPGSRDSAGSACVAIGDGPRYERARIVEEVVRRPPTESAEQRLGIYQRAYFSRLEECLADDYSALRFALGQDAFRQLCREYVASCPSTGPNLNSFGVWMSAFIRQAHPAWVFEAELAELEWALVHAVHALAPEGHLAEGLSTVSPDDLATLRFVRSPAARLVATQYPVNGFLQAFLEERQPSKPTPADAWVVVVRNGYKIWRLDLSRDEATVLERLFQGRSLGEALDGVRAQAGDVQGWFRRWASAGIFTAVTSGAVSNDASAASGRATALGTDRIVRFRGRPATLGRS